jgi:2'-5' RNA ligase
MRLFVAVWPPAEVLDVLESLARPEVPGLRWTTRDLWHVTLRFHGAVDDARVPELLAELPPLDAEVTLGPATARLGRSVLVVPVAGLDEVAAAVRHPDDGPFRGHLTLARMRRGSVPSAVVGTEVSARWRARRATLVASETHPSGARYRIVEGA